MTLFKQTSHEFCRSGEPVKPLQKEMVCESEIENFRNKEEKVVVLVRFFFGKVYSWGC